MEYNLSRIYRISCELIRNDYTMQYYFQVVYCPYEHSDNLNELVNDVVINMRPIVLHLMSNRDASAKSFINDLKKVLRYNIFGDKLRIVESLDKGKEMSITTALAYLNDYDDDEDDW